MNEQKPKHYLQEELPHGVTGQVEVVTPAREQLERAQGTLGAIKNVVEGFTEEASEGDVSRVVDETVAGYVRDGSENCADDKSCVRKVEMVGVLEVAELGKQPKTAAELSELLDRDPGQMGEVLQIAEEGGVENIKEVVEEIDNAEPEESTEEGPSIDVSKNKVGALYSELYRLNDLSSEELLIDDNQEAINSVVENMLSIDPPYEFDGSPVRFVTRLVERATGSTMEEWPERLLKSPSDCDKRIKALMEAFSGNGIVKHCAEKAYRRFNEHNFIESENDLEFNSGEYRQLIERYKACVALVLGQSEAAKRTFREFGDSLIQSEAISVGDQKHLTTKGSFKTIQYIGEIEKLGGENALKLHEALGITNFLRYNDDTLNSMVDLVNGKADPNERYSVVLIGKSGDHNGGFSRVLVELQNRSVIPLEVASPNDIIDRIETLRDLGVTEIDRLTIAGHGGREGLLLSSGYNISRDHKEIEESPVRYLVDMVAPDRMGRRNINLMSCSAARRFDSKGSLADCFSRLGDGIVVHGPSDISAPSSTSYGEDFQVYSLLERVVYNTRMEWIPGGEKIKFWIIDKLSKYRRNLLTEVDGSGKMSHEIDGSMIV